MATVYKDSSRETGAECVDGITWDSVNYPNDPHGLKRLRKSQAKTPEGMMRLAEKIIEGNLPQRANDRIERPKRPKYVDQRCVTIDPNAYRAPFNRLRTCLRMHEVWWWDE